MDVVGFSQMQYAMLMTIGFVTCIIGSLVFGAYFKQASFRLIIFLGLVINFVGAILTLLFVS